MSGRVGLLQAISGEYEDYRERSIGVFTDIEAARSEAARRNALVAPARAKYNATWDLADDKWEIMEKRQKRILSALQRAADDALISASELGDLIYTVEELPLFRPVLPVSQEEQRP